MVDDDDKHEHLSPQEIAFMDGGGGIGHGKSRLYDGASAAPNDRLVARRQRRTRGALRASATEAWVYVATDPEGLIKIGMSSNLPSRMTSIGAELRLCVHTIPSAARHIETEAFHAVGHAIDTGEWFRGDLASAMAAVWNAYTNAARTMRVHPSLSEEDARRMRIGLASCGSSR